VRTGSCELSVQINHYEQLAPGQKVFLTFSPDHALCLPK
jgi:hypothetical protein